MLIALLTLAVGMLALWMARRVSRDIRKGREWPAVPGKILERRVGDAMGQGRTYMPHVKYTYSVAGREYTNDQVYLIRRTGNLADVIQRLVDGLPDPVPVRYDPNDPTQSYLLVNPMSTVWIVLGFGVLALVMGLLQVLVVLAK